MRFAYVLLGLVNLTSLHVSSGETSVQTLQREHTCRPTIVSSDATSISFERSTTLWRDIPGVSHVVYIFSAANYCWDTNSRYSLYSEYTS